jgi:superfamily I DNA/RNA helicase
MLTGCRRCCRSTPAACGWALSTACAIAAALHMAARPGCRRLFQILDSQDQLRLVKRVMKSRPSMDRCKYTARQGTWFINNWKEGSGSARRQGRALRPRHASLARVSTASLRRGQCERQGLVDFAELLLRSHELLADPAGAARPLPAALPHILVDEFQDTNTIQYAWIRMLAGPAPRRCSRSATMTSRSTAGAAPRRWPTCRPTRAISPACRRVIKPGAELPLAPATSWPPPMR